MIKSMTGFGKQIVETPKGSIAIEIRTLNSKQQDVYLKLPQTYREKELVIRELVGRILQRGKIEVSINASQNSSILQTVINMPVAQHYYNEFNKLALQLEQKTSLTELLPILIKLPDVLSSQEEEIDAGEWKLLLNGIKEAAMQVDAFRKQEGEILAGDLRQRVQIILDLLPKVEPFEKERTRHIKKRIQENLIAYTQEIESDKNRLEQEMIYYIQKLDITEEKIRLRKHCDYFIETMESGSAVGKKLGFIGQEIGREINTLGSKANDVNIQKIVVLMKDELEKIKEQLFNIL